MDDHYDNCLAATIPTVNLSFLRDLFSMQNEESNKFLQKFVRTYYRRDISINIQPHVQNQTFTCNFGKRLNDILDTIPIETVPTNEVRYSMETLMSLGWAVLTVHKLGIQNHSLLLHFIVNKLLKTNPTKESFQFLNDLWDFKYSCLVQISLLEDIIQICPLYIEKLILQLFDNLTLVEVYTPNAIDSLLKQDDVKHWMNICAQSPVIFQISARIMHTLLLFSKGHLAIVTFIYTFFSLVRGLVIKTQGAKLSGHKQILLYPADLIPMVSSLSIVETYDKRDLTLLCSDVKKGILEKLMDGLVSNRVTYLCLLSHFPRWISHLFQYGIAIGEGGSISKKLFSTEFQRV